MSQLRLPPTLKPRIENALACLLIIATIAGAIWL